MDGHFLQDLVIVLCTAAVTTVVFGALRQPVVLGYLLAGLLIGPHVAFPVMVSAPLVRTLSELGVILLMFSIGLEFSVRTIAKVGVPAGLTATVEVGLMISLGYLAGLGLGWTGTEALFLGACLGISSTMLVARAFADLRLAGGFVELVFAILVFEDLFAILLLAILTAVATGHGLSGVELATMVAQLAGFLAAMLVAGLLIVPRAIRLVARQRRAEMLLVASLGVCFGMALIAEHAGYSIALGAFLGGMLIAESGKAHDVGAVITPFRDVFSAIFFVSVGMSIDPALIATHWLPVAVLTPLVIAGKVTGVTAGAFLSGNPLRRSVRAGMSLGQIGEFSFIIAALGASTGAVGDHLLPVAVAVSCLTAFATPWLIRASGRAADLVDARLPPRLQTLVTFYASWIERLRAAPRGDSRWRRLRRPLVLLIVDAALLAAAVIGAAVVTPRLAPPLADRLELDPGVARFALLVAGGAIAALFLFGVARRVRRLGRALAAEVVPPGPDGQLDLGTAPRRVLVLTLDLAIALAIGVPLAALLAPFVPAGGAILAIVLLLIAWAVWRSARNLDGHVRAGSALIVEALAQQSRAATEPAHLDHVEAMLPGFAGLAPVTIGDGSPGVGRSLAEVNLRARTGATVLAITRGDGGTAFPTAGEVLRAGDVLALAGSDEAVAAARAILAGEAAPAD